MISAKCIAVPLGESFLKRWCRSTISTSNPLPFSASAVSRTSLNSRFTTRLMFGAKSTAVVVRAASISPSAASVCPVVATTSGILPARRRPAGSAIVPSGAEKSMTQSDAGRSGSSPVTGTPSGPTPGDLAGVPAAERVARRIDGRDDLQLGVVLRERDEPLAHPPARPVDRDVRLHRA